jgi:hypothetical protein
VTRLSVIVPILNEGIYLPRLIEAFNQQPRRPNELIGPTRAALFALRIGIAYLEESDQDAGPYAADTPA